MIWEQVDHYFVSCTEWVWRLPASTPVNLVGHDKGWCCLGLTLCDGWLAWVDEKVALRIVVCGIGHVLIFRDSCYVIVDRHEGWTGHGLISDCDGDIASCDEGATYELIGDCVLVFDESDRHGLILDGLC